MNIVQIRMRCASEYAIHRPVLIYTSKVTFIFTFSIGCAPILKNLFPFRIQKSCKANYAFQDLAGEHAFRERFHLK